MNALAVLYGGSLSEAALEKVFSGKSALELALERTASFPAVEKTLLLTGEDRPLASAALPPGPYEIISRSNWTKKALLDTLASASTGFDLTYYAWADCPLLDPLLAGAIRRRHLRFAAEYSYADGWPYGLAPEVFSPRTARILAQMLTKAEDAEEPVERDAVFSVIQEDINSFDIETEISPVDLRHHRLTLCADSKRNLLLTARLFSAGLNSAASAEEIIAGRPELLRTLPNFYPIQAAGPCPQTCAFCPYPRSGLRDRTEGPQFLDPGDFAALLDKIEAFSGDAVVDLSLWGELSLHPRREELIRLVLDRPALSLVIETSGLGWKTGELEALAILARQAAPRKNRQAPLSWIVSLDAMHPERYREVRGSGYPEAVACARQLAALFPRDAYVQAVRVKGAEDDIEIFYRAWQGAGVQVIIQKYDSFCGYLPALQASDLSPVRRNPCWHLMRDMPVLLDGRVPCCREDIAGERILGNALKEDLEVLWARGEALYREQTRSEYAGLCAGCDEYYTYNF
ncbi:MAG: spiro-SPASM protein [Spirochaetaceae bacterium]|jgi:spiro-SPASM protein|nr:spiro-SPASM protein [Spirochaetaceae bacterium]